MKRIMLALLAPVLALLTASHAGGQSYFFGGGVLNPDVAVEWQGQGADGLGTVVLGGGSGNGEGSYTPIGSAIAHDWSGYRLYVHTANSAGQRLLLTISHDGGSTAKVANLYVQPTNSARGVVLDLPLKVAAGSAVSVKVRNSVGGGSVKVIIEGRIANAATPPGYQTATQLLAVDTSATRAATSGGGGCVAVASGVSWTPVVASTGTAYGAFLLSVSDNGSIGAPQDLRLRLGLGASGSEVEIGGIAASSVGSGALLSRANLPLVERAAPAGSRLSFSFQAAATGDTLCGQILAFN
ncbi:MAG: hypothetical protein KIS90_16580 [Phenylobacterium sp.]|nr:hypothetical protein [Phenylobacterium sp.]